MNPLTHPNDTPSQTSPLAQARRTRHLRNALLAYGAILFASVAAATAVVTDTVPLMVGGF